MTGVANVRAGKVSEPALRALEARMLEHGGVLDCAATVRAMESVDADATIVAYVVSNTAVPLAELRALASSAGCAPPDAVVRVSNIPLTESGDVDAAALARLAVIEPSAVERYRASIASIPGLESAAVALEWDAPADAPLDVDALIPRVAPIGRTPPSRQTAHGSQSASHASDDSAAASRPSLSVGAPIATTSDPPRRLSDLLMRAAAEHPEHRVTCVEQDGEFALSYPELQARAERILGGLRAEGVRAGDIVIFEIERSLEFIVAFWACTLGGMVPAPISVPHGADPTSAAALKLKNAWELLGEPYVLTSAGLAPLIQSLADAFALPTLRTLTVERLAESVPDRVDQAWHDAKADDLALLLLTSGSSGKPKAVTQTHAALLAHVAAHAQAHGFTSTDVPLNWLALDHVGSIVMLHLGGVALAANQVHVRTEYILQDVVRWLDLIERHRATITWAPNFAFALVNDRGDEVASRRRDLSSMRFIVNGGEAVVASTARRFLRRLMPHGLPATAMRPAWGMSETSSAEVISSRFTLESSSDADEYVEVGPPNPGFEIRIVDDEQRIVTEGREGHMEVRGTGVTRGYLNNAEANASAFTSDGWFRTGDLGWLRDGRMTISGRAKGEIIVNGVNYPAHEVEAAVEEVPGVSSSFAAAFAVREPEAQTDSLAVAFHARQQDDATLAELMRRIRQRVFDRVGVLPRFVISVEQSDIPKTAIGKIQRAALTKQFAAGGLAQAVARSEQLTRRADTIPDWFFRWTWRKRNALAAREVGAGTSVIVVTDAAGVGARIADLLRGTGASAVTVSRGELRDALARVRGDDAALVLLGHGFDRRAEPGSNAEPAMAHDAARDIIDVVRAIAESNVAGRPVDLVVYDSRVQRVMPDDKPVIGRASVIGLLRTIPTEHPAIRVRHVDVAFGNVDAAARAVVAELGDTRDEPEVAYRQGVRWVRRLEKRPPRPAGLPSALAGNGGFVAVVGGLGGIGFEVSRHILRTLNVPVLLIGRQPIESTDTGHRERFAALQALGAVRYACPDIADFEQLKQAIDDAAHAWRLSLAGVVHAAGVFEPRLLADESDETLGAALRSKVDGGWNVHRILMDHPGAAFVAFSSVNGELGGYTAGAYAAANAFLDGLVQHLVDAGARAAHSLAWTLWDGVGMSREHAFKESAARRGYRAVSVPQGLVSFAAALAGEPGQTLIGLDPASPHVRRYMNDAPMGERVAVSTPRGQALAARALDPDLFGAAIPIAVREVDSDGNAGAAHAVGTQSGQFGNELERVIAGVWCDVLSTTAIGPSENFFDVGGTSLLVATATRRMREALGRDIAMTDIYQFPSVRLLATHYAGDGADAATLDESEERGRARRAQRLDRRRRER
jgi:acyl-CoA synthetase (AMP-forming)/AMP-acid ligase II/NADP-dependent 3-hydroxy acid dehydrogenase YdfG